MIESNPISLLHSQKKALFREFFLDFLPNPAQRHAERLSELLRHADANLNFSQFNGTDICAMDARFVGKILLRDPKSLPMPTDSRSEKFCDF